MIIWTLKRLTITLEEVDIDRRMEVKIMFKHIYEEDPQGFMDYLLEALVDLVRPKYATSKDLILERFREYLIKRISTYKKIMMHFKKC